MTSATVASSSSSSERRGGPARLGLVAAQPRAEAQRLAATLEELWHTTIGPLRDLESDLTTLKRYYDPVATGARLRRDLARVPSPPAGALGLTAPLVLDLGDGRALPTPEGRAALDVLRETLLHDRDPILLTDSDVVSAERALLDVYRGWSRHRIDQVLALQSGMSKPLQLPAIGLLLTLLVARIDDSARAVHLPDDLNILRQIDRAFVGPADTFAKTLMPNLSHDAGKESLRQGWWLGEVTRRIPTAVIAGDDQVYITPEGRDTALRLAARELAGRPVDAAAVARAFDALVGALRADATVRAGFDLAFERPAHTDRLRQRLIDEYREEVSRRDDASSGAA